MATPQILGCKKKPAARTPKAETDKLDCFGDAIEPEQPLPTIREEWIPAKLMKHRSNQKEHGGAALTEDPDAAIPSERESQESIGVPNSQHFIVHSKRTVYYSSQNVLAGITMEPHKDLAKPSA